MIRMIWAQGKKGELGLENSLPWYYPEDMEHFKKCTYGSVVVMGSNTYRSLGKPLPGRTNVILTRDPEPVWAPPSVRVYNSAALLLNDLKKCNSYIIGGREIYELFMPHADELIVTHINREFEATTFAPKIDPDKWYENEIRYGKNKELKFVTYTKLKGGD